MKKQNEVEYMFNENRTARIRADFDVKNSGGSITLIFKPSNEPPLHVPMVYEEVERLYYALDEWLIRRVGPHDT